MSVALYTGTHTHIKSLTVLHSPFQALLRLLGLIFLIAFTSYWVQLPGLYGEGGLEPVSTFLQRNQRWMGAR